MPRASRYLQEGYTYHLTHRCHDQRYLLHFSQERKAYREWLRVGAKRYGVSVYGYCITSSHTHVIAHVDDRNAVAQMAGNWLRSTAERACHDDNGVLQRLLHGLTRVTCQPCVKGFFHDAMTRKLRQLDTTTTNELVIMDPDDLIHRLF